MKTRLMVIVTEHVDEEALAWLSERCEVVRCSSEEGRFGELLERAEGLLIRTYTRVDAGLLARAGKLRVVARAGVGLDNVDLGACAARGVKVVSTPGANTRAVVEYVFAMLLDELRPRVFLEQPLGVGEWKKLRGELIGERQLSDLTLGVVGYGRVGSGVGRVGGAMEMRVVYNDLLEIPAEGRFGGMPRSFEEVLEESDVLTLHVDGRAENRHLLDERALRRCKRNVVIVNTSRGFVVDEGALAGFLRANPGARALLDVHEPEPPGAEYPLWGLANARISPHIAAATRTAHRNMSWVVRDLWRELSGEKEK